MEMLRPDLKGAPHTRHLRNMEDLGSKIPPQCCVNLIGSYRKRLVKGIAAKGEFTGQIQGFTYFSPCPVDVTQ